MAQTKQKKAKPRRNPKRMVKILAFVALASLVALVGSFGGFHRYRRLTLGNPEVSLEITGQESAFELHEKLEAGGVDIPLILFKLLYELEVRFRGGALRAGTVEIPDRIVAQELVTLLTLNGRRKDMLIHIPQGYNVFQIDKRLAQYRICPKGEFASKALVYEGRLMPSRYLLLTQTPASHVAKLMHEKWLRNHGLELKTLKRNSISERSKLSNEQLVTLASIIEREGMQDRERPIIAGVFYNRLLTPSFRPKRLQADPTIVYGCLRHPETPSCKNARGSPYQLGEPISRVMRDGRDNPYSTYAIEGLPPSPICTPSLESLRAAYAPASHAYFYFMAKGDGTHAFSSTLEQHKEAVIQYRR